MKKFQRARSRALFTIVGGAVLINPAFLQTAMAQENSAEELDEVVVTGLRGSLTAAAAQKRAMAGVVDLINAEDIGKFPDSNLSESLQRITGISIDRRFGEGSQVTARGFGGQFNMVTLNGRAMPAADAFGGGEGTSRSFNFANLASEAVNGLEVYKTGRADITPGGIGASINIKTAKPFDNEGWVANVGVKALNDTTNRVGDDITPEVSGIFSFANDAKTWGVGLNASYQKRDSGQIGSNLFDWQIRRWSNNLETVATQTALSRDPGTNAINATIVNAPEEGQLYGIPNDIRYNFTDNERTRTNGQLTFQFAPTESLTLTTDYTYAENHLVEMRGEQTTWMNANRFNLIEFDTGREVATPVMLQEDEGFGKDFSYAQEYKDQTNTLRSLGFNAAWQATDNFGLNFDFHDSEMESRPTEPQTGAGQVTVHLGGRVPSTCDPVNTALCTNRMQQTFYFNDGLPVSSRTLFPQPSTSVPASGGNSNYDFPLSQMGTQMLQIFAQDQNTEIRQARLDGELQFEDVGRFKFGVESRALEMTQRGSFGQMTLGNWGIANVGEFPEDLLTPFSLINQFEDFGTAGIPVGGWRGNAIDLGQWAMGPYGDWNEGSMADNVLARNPAYNQNNTVEEDTQAAYLSFGLKSELGSMPVNVLMGVRYEQTDVTSTSNILLPTGYRWEDNNDFTTLTGTVEEAYSEEAEYDHVLPSVDFDIGLTENIKARASYSKTIARAQYNLLRAGSSIGGPQGSRSSGLIAGASSTNPALLPLESDNLDIAFEYYFGQSSYVAVTLWDKRVANFIGNEVVEENVFGIRDQTAGPRAQAAYAALRAGNANNGNTPYSTDDTNLFVMMAMMENAAATGGAAAFNGTEAQHVAIAAQYDILPANDDPLYIFNVNKPVNNKEANIYGVEFGGQHFFGDTGFGVQANYTVVQGDVAFDDAGDPSINQFALQGLSDTANVVLMFEKFGLSARLAYNWRDTFLRDVNRGGSRNPGYVEDYQQIDLNVGYELNEHLSVSFEGINLTGEDNRTYARSPLQIWDLTDQGPRYALGARYKF